MIVGKVRVQVRCVGGSRFERIVATASEVPGLCVHPTLYDDPKYRVAGFWTVTHAPSGMGVLSYLPNEPVALLAADWLGREGGDWTRGKETVLADPVAQRAALMLRARLQPTFDVISELVADLTLEEEPSACLIVH